MELSYLTDYIEKIVLLEDKTGIYLSLIGLIFICSIYLWIVLIRGPKLMVKKEPYNVSPFIRIYNIFQVVVCTYCVIRAYQLGFNLSNFGRCTQFEFLTRSQKLEVYIGAWLFMGLRTLEFIETIFFVLRKKYNQASFLHIFHHIGSVMMVWLFLALEAEITACYIAVLNSFVHLIMYSYYFLSNFKNEKIVKFTTEMKPCITILQLVQFVFIITHCTIVALPPCNFSVFFPIQIVNFTILFYLFAKFFWQTYVKKPHQYNKTNVCNTIQDEKV